MELFLLLGIFAVGFVAGKHYGYYHIVKLMKEVAAEQGIDLQKELGLVEEQEEKKPSVYKLNVEQHGDLLYLFDVEKDKFICQGASVQELCELAKQQKNVLYAAVKHGDRVFQFKDGVSVEVV